MNAQVIYCRCSRPIAICWPDGSYEMRHKGRSIQFYGPAKVSCEECGHVTALDKEVVSVLT